MDVSDFVDSIVYPNLFLADSILSVAVLDFVYTVSGTTLPFLDDVRTLLHVCVAVGAVLLFWPLIIKILGDFGIQI